MKQQNWKWLVGFALSFTAFSLLSQYLSGNLPVGKRLEKVYEQPWKSSAYGDPAIQVETPGQLSKVTLQLPAQVQQYVDQMASYQYKEENGLLISVTTIAYKPEVQPNLQGAATGSVNEMKNGKGMEDFTHTEADTTISNREGIVQNGSFKSNGERMDFTNLIVVSGQNAWQVLVATEAGSEYGAKIRSRIIRSIKL
jgi:hypothetical protein